jgi:hypothetical protein
LSLAGAGDAAQEAGRAAGVAAPDLSGTYVIDRSASDDPRRALEASLSSMGRFKRRAVDKKLADAMKPADTVAVAMHGDTVVLTTSGRLHVSVVPGGDAKSRSGNKGGSAELSAAWQGETLVVTTTSEKFRRETRYSLDGDRSRLRIAVTMRAEKLSQPIVYTLVYRRVG